MMGMAGMPPQLYGEMRRDVLQVVGQWWLKQATVLISKDTSDTPGAEFLCSWNLNNWMQICVKEGNLTK